MVWSGSGIGCGGWGGSGSGGGGGIGGCGGVGYWDTIAMVSCQTPACKHEHCVAHIIAAQITRKFNLLPSNRNALTNNHVNRFLG